MAHYKDLASLLAHVQKEVNDSLLNDVAPAAEKAMQEQIGLTVYDSYTPSEYERRGELGSSSNITSESVGDGQVFVKNTAKSSPSVVDGSVSDALPQWVNDSGVPNIFGAPDAAWAHPRDFIGATVSELESNQTLKKTLAASLNAKGIKTVG